MSYVFRHQGLDVSHESIGSDGGVGFTVGPTQNTLAAIKENTQRYGPFYHLSRHPLNVLSGLLTMSNSWASNFCTKQMPDHFTEDEFVVNRHSDTYEYLPPLPTMMKFWYYWTLRCLSDDRPILLLERFCDPKSGVFQALSAKIDYPLEDRFLLSVSRNTATKSGREQYRKLSWGDLDQVDATLADKMRHLTERIGHEL